MEMSNRSLFKWVCGSEKTSWRNKCKVITVLVMDKSAFRVTYISCSPVGKNSWRHKQYSVSDQRTKRQWQNTMYLFSLAVFCSPCACHSFVEAHVLLCLPPPLACVFLTFSFKQDVWHTVDTFFFLSDKKTGILSINLSPVSLYVAHWFTKTTKTWIYLC